jgi:hypothetical protein
MPLIQYFGWVGSALVAALLAANWCVSVPTVRAPHSDVPLDQKINIRIHTDHKWPERVVFDTTTSPLVKKPDAETGADRNHPPVVAETRPLDAFAEMAAAPARPSVRPSCPQATARKTAPSQAAPFQVHSRIAARKELTFPNPLHKQPGRS